MVSTLLEYQEILKAIDENLIGFLKNRQIPQGIYDNI